MATDEKTTAEDAPPPKDTMHAGPNALPAGFDTTSNAATRDLVKEGYIKPPPDPTGVKGEKSEITVGEFDPEPGSTLVTDIPDNEERMEREREARGDMPEGVVNPGNPAPATVAQQPGETADEAGERIAKAEKASSKKEPAKSGSK